MSFATALSRSLGAAFAVAASLALVAPAAAADAPKPEGTVDMAAVLKPGPLPELALGDANGVAVVEYGSLTCPHCAVFDHEVLPKLKEAYIDTGKVRFTLREFPFDPVAVAGFMVARCGPCVPAMTESERSLM